MQSCHVCYNFKLPNIFYAVCCKKRCHKPYCTDCILKHFDNEFNPKFYKGDTWICYSCQERCICNICTGTLRDKKKGDVIRKINPRKRQLIDIIQQKKPEPEIKIDVQKLSIEEQQRLKFVENLPPFAKKIVMKKQILVNTNQETTTDVLRQIQSLNTVPIIKQSSIASLTNNNQQTQKFIMTLVKKDGGDIVIRDEVIIIDDSPEIKPLKIPKQKPESNSINIQIQQEPINMTNMILQNQKTIENPTKQQNHVKQSIQSYEQQEAEQLRLIQQKLKQYEEDEIELI